MRSLASGIIGHQDNFIVSSGCRWSSDLAEPHQPGGRDLQRGSGGHTEQPRGGAAHYLTAKRCSVCVRVCVSLLLYTLNLNHVFVLWVISVCSSDASAFFDTTAV